jgi:hypothetical protein
VRLAREGGLSLGDESLPRGPWDTSGIHGLQQLRKWDVVATVDAPELDGERASFVALASGDVLVEEGPDAVEPLAATVERELPPPYRAEAVRRHGTLWAVAARSIQVLELPDVAGDEVELALHHGQRTLLVDGVPAFGSVPALERPEYVVRASRVDGDYWEVSFDPL